jgi:hypothetical protein
MKKKKWQQEKPKQEEYYNPNKGLTPNLNFLSDSKHIFDLKSENAKKEGKENN